MAKKGRKKLPTPTTRQEKYLGELLETQGNTSKYKCALKAGYSEAMAKNTKVIESSLGFQRLLTKRCKNDIISERLEDGLNAIKVRINNKGEECGQDIDYNTRLNYLKEILKLKNYYPKDRSETLKNNLSTWLQSVKSDTLQDTINSESI